MGEQNDSVGCQLTVRLLRLFQLREMGNSRYVFQNCPPRSSMSYPVAVQKLNYLSTGSKYGE